MDKRLSQYGMGQRNWANCAVEHRTKQHRKPHSVEKYAVPANFQLSIL